MLSVPPEDINLCGEVVSLGEMWGRAGDGPGHEHWACSIEPSDLKIAKPIFHSWVAAICAAARRATGSSLWLGRPGPWVDVACSYRSILGPCSSALQTAVETLGSQSASAVPSSAAWRVTSRV